MSTWYLLINLSIIFPIIKIYQNEKNCIMKIYLNEKKNVLTKHNIHYKTLTDNNTERKVKNQDIRLPWSWQGWYLHASTKIQHNQSSIQQYIPVSSNESDVTETVDHHFHAITRQKCTMNVTHMTYRTTRLTEESLINNKSTFVMRYKENLRDQMVNTFTLAR